MSQEDAATAEKTAAEKVEVEVKPEGKTFDEAYVKELRSEAAKWRVQAQQNAEKAEEFENQNKSELDKALTKAQKAEQAKAEAEAKLVRFEVAKDKAVPAEAVDFLKGNTREELEASAEKLLELVKSRTDSEKAPDFDGGAREPAPDPKTEEEQINEISLGLLGVPVTNQ